MTVRRLTIVLLFSGVGMSASHCARACILCHVSHLPLRGVIVRFIFSQHRGGWRLLLTPLRRPNSSANRITPYLITSYLFSRDQPSYSGIQDINAAALLMSSILKLS